MGAALQPEQTGGLRALKQIPPMSTEASMVTLKNILRYAVTLYAVTRNLFSTLYPLHLPYSDGISTSPNPTPDTLATAPSSAR